MKKTIFSIIFCLTAISVSVSAQKTGNVGIVAHRGYWNCPEAGYARNSVAALKCAQDAGFWGSEFDVNMTRDEVLVVFHDDTVAGKKIKDHDWAEFKDIRLENGETIPTLDDYLAQAVKHPETVLVFELKPAPEQDFENRMVDLSIERLKEFGIDTPDKVIFISFSINICERFARKMPGFTVQYLDDDFSPAELAGRGITGVDYHYEVFDKHPEWYDEARGLGMTVNCWTVNEPKDMEAMLGLGVDLITTDCPDKLKSKINFEKFQNNF